MSQKSLALHLGFVMSTSAQTQPEAIATPILIWPETLCLIRSLPLIAQATVTL